MSLVFRPLPHKLLELGRTGEGGGLLDSFPPLPVDWIRLEASVHAAGRDAGRRPGRARAAAT
eukprot:3787908-Pyramimonas_sp.AAC.1